ncbi:MAG: hypothetical protein AAF391_07420 [Bacteroidota bacterium]
MKKYIFTEEEKERIQQAVKDLEKQSCGEIVPFFARKSDEYEEVPWKLASISGLSCLCFVAFLSYTWSLPNVSVLLIAFIIIVMMTIGYLIPVLFPIIKRTLVAREKMTQMVSKGAKEAFLEEKVHETAEHVGILIYISRLEHIVMVLGDEGINQKVQQEDWERVIALITDGLKKKNIGDGLVNGINHCKELLLQNGFIRKESDTNELSDELRVKE